MESKYDEMLEKYLQEGINWDAYKNEVIKTANKSELAKGDVEQFASDSYWQGWQDANSEDANRAIFDVIDHCAKCCEFELCWKDSQRQEYCKKY